MHANTEFHQARRFYVFGLEKKSGQEALLCLIDNVYDKAHFNYGHEPTIQIGRDAAVLGGRTAAGPITIRPS